MPEALELLSQQKKAMDKVMPFKVGALFMKPGTGKTLPAYRLVKSVPEVDYILWLTPFRTKENLAAEIAKYGGFAQDIDIVGIETLSSSGRTYLYLHEKLRSRNGFIVVDESLKIKNWQAIRTKRILELGNLCEYKLILNGTPFTLFSIKT